MFPQSASISRRIGAVGALVGPLAGVGTHVSLQMASLSRLIGAVVALVGPLAGVSTHVPPKMGGMIC